MTPTESDKVITMNNKIIEIMDCVEHCCYAADVHSLSLSKNTNSINEYFLIVKLKNEIYCNPVQVNHFCDLSIKYLLFSKKKEFPIFTENAQIKSFDENTIIFIVNKDCSIPLLHPEMFNQIENKLGKKYPIKEWKRLDENNKYLWLRLNCYFCQSKIYDYPERKNGEYVIDGYFCANKLDFLCELGEALFGIDGYVGSDLDGLHDALTGGIGVNFNEVGIIWNNHNYSKNKMGNTFNEIVSTIKSTGYVKLILN